MAQQVCGGHDPYVHPGVGQQGCECITSRIALGTQLPARGDVALRMFVTTPSASLEDFVSLGSHAPSELLHQLLKLRHQKPFLTFSMARRYVFEEWETRLT
jgi:hypothetical protein